MSVLVADPDLTIHVGDALDVLRALPAESVDLVATSPPFYALRDYGVEGQIGLESTPDEWVAALVAVFAECRRVLRPAGSLWVECGDSYNAHPSGSRPVASLNHGLPQPIYTRGTGQGPVKTAKPKDLLGTPFLLAFALRADGWYWRGCYPWAKPNCMPESAKDRCTTAHSYVLHFAKQARYFFDGDAIAEPVESDSFERTMNGRDGTGNGFGDSSWSMKHAIGTLSATRNPRSVWTIPTQGFAGAHFATWPEALARRIILAGCPEWVCGTCGVARSRLTDVTYGKSPVHGAGSTIRKRNEDTDVNGWAGETMPRLAKHSETVGWSDCGHGNYQPGTVLDPFGGSGTTGLVARKHGRRAILIELNPEYARLAAERCQQLSLLAEVSA